MSRVTKTIPLAQYERMVNRAIICNEICIKLRPYISSLGQFRNGTEKQLLRLIKDFDRAKEVVIFPKGGVHGDEV